MHIRRAGASEYEYTQSSPLAQQPLQYHNGCEFENMSDQIGCNQCKGEHLDEDASDYVSRFTNVYDLVSSNICV